MRIPFTGARSRVTLGMVNPYPITAAQGRETLGMVNGKMIHRGAEAWDLGER
jgi:hypothetical protein